MQTSRKDPKAVYTGQRAVGGDYTESSLPELERQRQARIKRLQEIEAQQLELHRRRLRENLTGRRRNARTYDPLMVLLALGAVVLLLLSSLSYVGRNAALHASNKQLASLKQEYETLRSDNNTREEMIRGSIDAEEVYRIATQELGMNYPQKHQVITYHKTESGYVAQYENIPE